MKPMFVISAPVDTYSGYGARSRDLVKAIIELDKYDVKIAPQMWGSTPWGFVEDNPEWSFLKDYFLTSPQLPKQPEIWMQITIPSEFQRIGKFNIGVTAGIETTLSPADWIEGNNRMDLVLTSSEHSKNVLLNTIAQKVDQRTNQVVGDIKVDKPIEVLFEGVDYKKTEGLELLDSIKEDFCFLFVGHWLAGDLYHDRKDVGGLLQTFLATFNKSKEPKPALILKTSSAGFSIRDREQIRKKIEEIKKTVNGEVSIYLLHGDLSEDDMWKLYNHPKVKATVSFTHGEGFGRPLLEFSCTGKPVVASNWSGQLDFLSDGAVLLEGELKQVHPSTANQFILKESQWFYVNYSVAATKLLDVYTNYNKYLVSSKKLAEKNTKEFSFVNMTTKLGEIISRYVRVTQRVDLKLPKLKKIDLPKLNQVK